MPRRSRAVQKRALDIAEAALEEMLRQNLVSGATRARIEEARSRGPDRVHLRRRGSPVRFVISWWTQFPPRYFLSLLPPLRPRRRRPACPSTSTPTAASESFSLKPFLTS